MPCHRSRGVGGEEGGASASEPGRMRERVSERPSVRLVGDSGGRAGDDTHTHVRAAHPAVEAPATPAMTPRLDDDDDGAATSSPHVFPTSLAHCSPRRSLVVLGHVT